MVESFGKFDRVAESGERGRRGCSTMRTRRCRCCLKSCGEDAAIRPPLLADPDAPRLRAHSPPQAATASTCSAANRSRACCRCACSSSTSNVSTVFTSCMQLSHGPARGRMGSHGGACACPVYPGPCQLPHSSLQLVAMQRTDLRMTPPPHPRRNQDARQCVCHTRGQRAVPGEAVRGLMHPHAPPGSACGCMRHAVPCGLHTCAPSLTVGAQAAVVRAGSCSTAHWATHSPRQNSGRES